MRRVVIRMFSSDRVRGTRDEYGPDLWLKKAVCGEARRLASQLGYEEIRTPVLEKTDLFVRGLGADSDVVSKELYTVEQSSLCLRPENTAGVVRAVLDGGLEKDLPSRWWYEADMFRRERPQKGRYRQFTQFGVEMFSSPRHRVMADVELIHLAHNTIQSILKKFSSSSSSFPVVKLHLNTLGDGASRASYRAALSEWLQQRRSLLSPDSVARLDRGSVLRILDSKEKQDRALLADSSAPRLCDHLNETSHRYWQHLLRGLDAQGISYWHDEKLVRGLDYYQDAVYEFVVETKSDDVSLGPSQSTILAGGRYDALIMMMMKSNSASSSSSSHVCSSGWSLGVDRIALLCSPNTVARPTSVAVLCTSQNEDQQSDVSNVAMKLTHQLTSDTTSTSLWYGSSWSKLVKKADAKGVRYVVFVGEDEVRNSSVKVKDMKSGEEKVFPDVKSAKEFIK